jgi:hypothetical protein
MNCAQGEISSSSEKQKEQRSAGCLADCMAIKAIPADRSHQKESSTPVTAALVTHSLNAITMPNELQ